MEYLPLNTTLIKISFRLARPYISRDDSEIYTTSKKETLENPIARDKLTSLPMVKATGWERTFAFFS